VPAHPRRARRRLRLPPMAGRKGSTLSRLNGELPGTLPMAAGTGEALRVCCGRRAPACPRTSARHWWSYLGETIASSRTACSYEGLRSGRLRSPSSRGARCSGPWESLRLPTAPSTSRTGVDQDYQVHYERPHLAASGKDGEAAAVAASGGSTTAAPAGAAASKSPAGESERAAAACVARRVKLEAFLEGAARDPSGAERAAEEIRALAGSDGDPFIECAAINALARACGAAWLLDHRSDSDPRMRLRVAARSAKDRGPAARRRRRFSPRPGPRSSARRDAVGRRGAPQGPRGQLEKSLDIASASGAILDAWLAAMSLLTNEAPDARDAVAADDFLLALARGKTQGDSCEPSRSDRFRRATLPSTTPRWPFSTRAGRTAPPRSRANAPPEVKPRRKSAHRRPGAQSERAGEPAQEAIAGLAAGAPRPAAGTTLRELTHRRKPESATRRNAPPASWAPPLRERGSRRRIRPAGSPGLDAATAAKALSWRDATGESVSFFHPGGPRCSNCHSARGRGGRAGPDLSNAGQTARAKLLESIVDPAKEVAPQYTSWTFITRNGVRTGTLLGEDPDGTVAIADASGAASRLAPGEILGREMAKGSLMRKASRRCSSSTSCATSSRISRLFAEGRSSQRPPRASLT
jgi:putative heme-binding domain-containing protein